MKEANVKLVVVTRPIDCTTTRLMRPKSLGKALLAPLTLLQPNIPVAMIAIKEGKSCNSVGVFTI